LRRIPRDSRRLRLTERGKRDVGLRPVGDHSSLRTAREVISYDKSRTELSIYGEYMSASTLRRTFRGRDCRVKFIAYAFVATLTAIASEILRISCRGG
jgi:hypothetical protein